MGPHKVQEAFEPPKPVSDPAHQPLIIGSGIAGLFVALRCRELGLRPTLVTKTTLEESNTRYAQGGIATALGDDDSVELHWQDTRNAGDGLVDPEAARVLTFEAPARIADLVRFGVPFDTVDGKIALGREAAHSRARILHAGGDATGFQVEETLRSRALAEGIEVLERTVLRSVDVSTGGPTVILSTHGRGEVRVAGRPIVLATGGAGSLYRQSSNPSVATGDGIAIAFRAGALLTDMEFVQFHPTAFAREGAPRFLITEALRGEGALLTTLRGERFLKGRLAQGELSTRDVVCRAICDELGHSGAGWVLLDATAIPRDRLFARFPTVCRFLATYGLDPSRDPIPVAPAAHYTIGGVATDLEARTSLPGVLACGELASTGVHGANRLASNSLLEGLVFGERAVRQLLHPAPGGPKPPARLVRIRLDPGEGHDEPGRILPRVGELLWAQVGIVRNGPGLAEAGRELGRIQRECEPRSGELAGRGANATLTARIITRAALAREESRGAHYRSDFPRPRAAWRRTLGIAMGARRAGPLA
ncbi:MAG: L-aspartate oxidase [Thermoplasmata archaeon]|nr:L-aspartate oxidase [Thermoplasmata archaeon]